ncbi:RNA polymerase sigma factor [Catenuloplanes sp. NPDC051500]|uniref:RNA polymerase sigma factor n=1 Tax=Catenuloplanes sp. NPDC051500 TaxID=3363959 RepID=UPI003792D337
MARRSAVDDPEEGQRRDEAIPSLDEQPWRLSPAQVELGLTSAAHGPSLLRRLFCEGALAADRDSVWHYLSEHGIALVRHLVDSGEIFARFCYLTGGGTLGPNVLAGAAVESDRMELAEEATIECLSTFFGRLSEGRWRADGGASLYTYFTNGCILAVKKPYRRLLARMREIPFGDEGDRFIPGSDPDPGNRIAERIDIERVKAGLPERERTVLDMLSDDALKKDIAKRLGLTSESVRRICGRLRNHLRKGEDDD